MEFLIKFYEDYLCINLSDYKNIGLSFEINKLITILAIGLLIAAFGIYKHQSNMHMLLKKLARLESFDASSAKSLEELNLATSKSIRRLATNREGALRRCILIAPENSVDNNRGSNDENESDETTELPITLSGKADKSSVEVEESDTLNEETSSCESEFDAPGCSFSSSSVNSSFEDQVIYEEKADSMQKEKYYAVPVSHDGLISPDAKLYIPNDKKYLAQRLLETSATSPTKLLITCGLIVGLYAVLILTMPLILSAVNSMLAK